MGLTTLLLLSAGVALVGLVTGYFAGKALAGRRLRQADERYDALKHDFEALTAVNVRLMQHVTPAPAPNDGADRFYDLYDDAKRCLHRALDQHNATAPRPLVISRDGGNLLQVLSDLPERSFSDDSGEDAGVRAWVRRVLEMEIQRRIKRESAGRDAVIALERERELWRAPLKKRA